ncbi:sensor domain-containing diguanylate cyclase [Crenobacter cavernae]|uniref:sensor domain-containing diguanylate cyclase n=1 Tax=Crenobacter cavernae TaxID=2290923 RepID=UPI0011C05AC0|nr:sensor domain-containing diguanylate cyclase [Crenobacter cavernae]
MSAKTPTPTPLEKVPAPRLEQQILLIVACLAALVSAWGLANGYLQQRVRAERAEAALALDATLRTLELSLAEQTRQLEDELPRAARPSARIARLTGGGKVWRFGYDGKVAALTANTAAPDAVLQRLGLRALGRDLPAGALTFLPSAQTPPGPLSFAIAGCPHPPCTGIAVGRLKPWPLLRPNWPAHWQASIELKDENGQRYGRFTLGQDNASEGLPLWLGLMAPGLAVAAPLPLNVTRPLGQQDLLLEARLAPASFAPASPWLVALPLAALFTAGVLLFLVYRLYRQYRSASRRLEQLEQSYLLLNTSHGTLRERLKKLSASQRDLQTLIDTVQVGVVILDAGHWQIRACNQRAGDLFGCDANDLVGQSGERLFATETDLSLCRTLITQGMPVTDRDLSLKRQDDSEFWSLVSMRGLFHNGQPAVAISVVDVSERIAHAELLEAEKKATEHAMQQLQSAQAELVELATLDDLTGIANRRHFMKSATALLDQACRRERPLSVLMIDIDHFKQVNDTLGHDAGDAILSQTVTLCQALIRQHDVFGRIGGEEFCLVLPDSDDLTALGIAERIRERVANHPFRASGKTRQVTVSVGLTIWLPGEAPPALAALLKTADEALYRAKAQGRNQVVCARGQRSLDDLRSAPSTSTR